LAAVLVPPSAAQQKPPPLDFSGVPLPDGALARHGTVRMWHKTAITQLTFTPDGKGLLSMGTDLAFHKWELATGKELWQFDRKQVPWPLTKRTQTTGVIRVGIYNQQEVVRKILTESHARFLGSHSADGKVLAVADPSGNTVVVLNPTNGQQLHKIQLKMEAYALTVAPSGKLLAIGENNRHTDECALHLWDLVSGKELPTPKLSRAIYGISNLTFSRDEKQFAAVFSGRIYLWDLVANKRMRVYEHDNWVSDIAFSHDGQLLASASNDGSVRVWDRTTEEEIKKLSPPDTRFTAVAFMPDSKQIVAGDRGGNLHLWHLPTGADKILKGHGSEVAVLAISPSGATIASASGNGGMRLWDALSGEAKEIVRETQRFKGLGVADGGHALVVWAADGTVRQIDTMTGAEIHAAQGPPKEASRVKLTADGQTGAWFDRKEKSIFLWDAAAGRELGKVVTNVDSAGIIALSPDAQLVVSAETGGTLRIWNVASGKQIRSFAKVSMDSATFSPDGKLLLVLTEADELCLFEMATGKERCRLRTLCSNAEFGLAFAPNGRHLAVTADNAVCLWDLAKGKPLRGFYGHQGMVLAVAFAPKGDIVASGGSDGTVRLWKTDSGEELRCFSGHHGAIERLSFSQDGKMLISVGLDQNIIVWDAASRAAVKPVKADGKILERCWTELGHDDPSIAFLAMGDMIDQPKEAVALLAKKLEPVPAVEVGLIDKLIAELDSDTFTVREKAMKDLEKLEGQARKALAAAVENPTSAEVQARAKKLLERLDGPVALGEEARNLRALEVLERIGTPEARQLLARLGQGAPGARLTVEATASQARLAK